MADTEGYEKLDFVTFLDIEPPFWVEYHMVLSPNLRVMMQDVI